MARCSTKGCKAGATQRIVIIDSQGNSKGRPVCNPCSISQALADASKVGESGTVKVVEQSKKHH